MTNTCDIIRESEKITLPGGSELPIVFHKEYAVYSEEKFTLLDDDELYSLAEQRIGEEIKSKLGEAVILSLDKSMVTDSDGIHVTLSLYCLENIAKEVPTSGSIPSK